MYDIAIIGAGPAGLSAAITARARNKNVLVISNDRADSGLYKAPHVDNYPGLIGVSGAELSDKLAEHAARLGAELRTGRVTAILKHSDSFSLSFKNEFIDCRTAILALGVLQSQTFEGEVRLLGRGVSYCATCDGMLYRNKTVSVIALSREAEAEAEFLRSIGCKVIETRSKNVQIHGESKVDAVTIDGETLPCSAVFVLRDAIAPAALIEGLDVRDGHIAVSEKFEVSLNDGFAAGLYAAGDCVGRPYQIAKTVGEGQCAAFSAIEYLD